MCPFFNWQWSFIVYKLAFALVVAGLAGCASTHDLSKGSNMLGGGYKQEEMGPGLFYIYARSNHAPWTNLEAARTTWRTGAERACASAEYDEPGHCRKREGHRPAEQQWCALFGDRENGVCQMRFIHVKQRRDQSNYRKGLRSSIIKRGS